MASVSEKRDCGGKAAVGGTQQHVWDSRRSALSVSSLSPHAVLCQSASLQLGDKLFSQGSLQRQGGGGGIMVGEELSVVLSGPTSC